MKRLLLVLGALLVASVAMGADPEVPATAEMWPVAGDSLYTVGSAAPRGFTVWDLPHGEQATTAVPDTVYMGNAILFDVSADGDEVEFTVARAATAVRGQYDIWLIFTDLGTALEARTTWWTR